MALIKHFAAPAGMTTPPLSFAARTGDLLFVSGIPGFDENGKLPDDFEAQFGFVVRNIKACARRGRRGLSRSGQGQRAADARVLRQP
jgi:enamine deaminase RidA (YjgF/YER057c/UK114 family)